MIRTERLVLVPLAAGHEGAPAFRLYAEHGDLAGWLVTLATDGTVVGECRWRPGAEENDAEVAYVIDPAYRNRGYGTEAVAAMIEVLRGSRISAEVQHGNTASRRLLERLGFVEVARDLHGCVLRLP